MQEIVRRNSKNYLSIRRGAVSPSVRQVPCASAGGWPQRSTDDAPLSLPSSASFAFTEALSAAAEALPKAAKPSTAQWLQSFSFQPLVFWGSHFSLHHMAPLQPALRKGSLWLWKDNGPRKGSWEIQWQSWGPNLSWSLPFLPVLCVRKDTAVSAPRAEALYCSGAGATQSQNFIRRTGIAQQLVLQTKFFSLWLSAKCPYTPSWIWVLWMIVC